MVALPILGANRPRALRVVSPFYSVGQHRGKKLILASKPGELAHLDAIDQKAWKQYQTYLKRTSPLERAEFYAREMKERRIRTAPALALIAGDPDHMVQRYLRLLELPVPILDYLRANRSPAILRYFSHRVLEKLAQIRDPKLAWRRFRQMVAEAERDGGIWRSVTE